MRPHNSLIFVSVVLRVFSGFANTKKDYGYCGYYEKNHYSRCGPLLWFLILPIKLAIFFVVCYIEHLMGKSNSLYNVVEFLPVLSFFAYSDLLIFYQHFQDIQRDFVLVWFIVF